MTISVLRITILICCVFSMCDWFVVDRLINWGGVLLFLVKLSCIRRLDDPPSTDFGLGRQLVQVLTTSTTNASTKKAASQTMVHLFSCLVSIWLFILDLTCATINAVRLGE